MMITRSVLLLSISLFSLSTRIGADSDLTTFVLIHGPGGGGWWWYKVQYMLEQANFTVYTPDLASAGILDGRTADAIMTMEDYAQPVSDILESLDEKVILVSHSQGGGPATYLMEKHPEKIGKAVFVTALMPGNGVWLNTDVMPTFKSLVNTHLIRQNRAFGPFAPITSLGFNATACLEWYWNRSPLEDTNLATAMLTDLPYIPLDTGLTITEERYGSIDRYYIKTGLDKMIPLDVQNAIIAHNPPKMSFVLKNADHAPFFSEPMYLFTLLKNIPNL